VEFRAQRESEGCAHTPPERDESLEIRLPVRLMDDESSEDEVLCGRPIKPRVAALVHVHQVHAIPSVQGQARLMIRGATAITENAQVDIRGWAPWRNRTPRAGNHE